MLWHLESLIFLLKYENWFGAFIVILYVNLVNTCNVWIKFTPYSYAAPDSSLVLPTTISSWLHVDFLVHKVPVAGEELMATGGLWGKGISVFIKDEAAKRWHTLHSWCALTALSVLSRFFKKKNEQVNFIQFFNSNYSLPNMYKYLQLSLISTI